MTDTAYLYEYFLENSPKKETPREKGAENKDVEKNKKNVRLEAQPVKACK